MNHIFSSNTDIDKQSLEDHVALRSAQIGSLICFLGTISNLIIKMPLTLTLLTAIGIVIYGSFYFLAQARHHNEVLIKFIAVFTIVYLNILWVFNYMSNGPILYLLVVCYLFIQLLFKKSNAPIIAFIAFLNLAILFIIELFVPPTTNQYHGKIDKLVDTYIVAFLSIILLLAVVGVFKKYYLRELSHAQESDKLKSAFLANLSHEIRTPLNSIIGFSSLMSEDFSEDQKGEFLELIKDNGTQLCRLLDRLIIISKIESDNTKLTIRKCDLKDTFEDIYSEYYPSFSMKKLDFDYMLRGNSIVYVDRKMLNLVLTELISNSLKFSNTGRTRFGSIVNSEQYIFFVKDSGLGIREENMQKIFKIFVKVSESSSTLYGGTGLGLSIVKGAVQKMGGEIKVKSNYRKGSTFYFILPARKPGNLLS